MKLKSKNIKQVTILILLFLTSMYIMNFNYFVSEPNKIIRNEVEDKDIYNTLKVSLVEDWSVTWNKGDNEEGRGIAIDESTGDIYVVGYNGSADNDVVLIKYNSNGDQQWNVTWDNGGNEFGYEVALDSQGYVYVAGANGTGYPNFDVLLLKFNSSGEHEWNRTWDSGDYDAGWALKIDNANNIYIAGQTKASQGDLLLLKYDSSGVYKWNSTFGGANGQHGYDLALDSTNNIYVAGINTGANQDLVLVKFNSSGFNVWNRTWGGTDDDQGFGVVTDSGNSVYITGWTKSFGAIQRDFVVVKYDTAGNWKWNRTWGTTGDEEVWGIAVDSADNLYIGGFTKFANVSILKYSASGELLWDKQWGNTPTYQYWCYDMVIDSLDKIYITGRNRTGVIGIYDLFLAKLSIEAPGGFTLSSNAGSPDDDGAFTLTWTSSSGANNYSIYQYSSYITDINGSLTLLANETNSLSLPISGFSNGSYYFIAVAFNNFGERTSNSINIVVGIPPPSTFTLYSDAGSPDDDGNFTLTWTSSSGANNYSVYQSSSYIYSINGSLTQLVNEINILTHSLSGFSDGTYFFVVVAFNDSGNKTSNVLIIIVELTVDTSTTPGIPGFNLLIVGLVIGIISVILIKKKLKLK